MSTTEATAEIHIHVAAPIVFRALCNRDLATSWRWDLVSSAQTDAEPAHVGTTATQRRHALPIRETARLTALEPDTAVEWTENGPLTTLRTRFSLQSVGHGTHIRASMTRSSPLASSALSLQTRLETDLAHLRAWLEQGVQGDTSTATKPLSRLVRRLRSRRVQADLRMEPVGPERISVEIDRRHATCAMHCHFCPRTAAHDSRDLPPPDEAAQARILEQFERAIAVHPGATISLWSDDITRYPGLFDLLDAAASQGRTLHLHTPGLALADRHFAERFVGRALSFELTVHGVGPDTTLRMCGNPQAHDLIFQALENLDDLGIPYSISVVVTDRNASELAAIITLLGGRYHPKTVSVRAFYPDTDELGERYKRQFATYPTLAAQLRVIQVSTDPIPTLSLCNLPPCQIDASALNGLPIEWILNRNATRASIFAHCEICEARDVCGGVHPSYVAQHPGTLREPDPAHIADVLARTRHHGQRATDAHARVETLDAAGLLTLYIAPHSDRPAWLQSPTLTVWYAIDERANPGLRAHIEAALASVRARIDATALTLDDDGIERVLTWAREALR